MRHNSKLKPDKNFLFFNLLLLSSLIWYSPCTGQEIFDLASESPDTLIYGSLDDSRIGTLSLTGDINNDGYDDMVIRAYSSQYMQVFFGGPNSFEVMISNRQFGFGRCVLFSNRNMQKQKRRSNGHSRN